MHSPCSLVWTSLKWMQHHALLSQMPQTDICEKWSSLNSVILRWAPSLNICIKLKGHRNNIKFGSDISLVYLPYLPTVSVWEIFCPFKKTHWGVGGHQFLCTLETKIAIISGLNWIIFYDVEYNVSFVFKNPTVRSVAFIELVFVV